MQATRSALIVVDAQEYVQRMNSGPDRINNINALISVFRFNFSPVIFTKHLHVEYMDSQIHHKLKVCEDDMMMTKSGNSAFQNTPLKGALERLGVERLALCGVHTDRCVKATAVYALDAGYKVTLVRDCCASESEKGHRNFIRELKRNELAEVVSISDVMWGRSQLFGMRR